MNSPPPQGTAPNRLREAAMFATHDAPPHRDRLARIVLDEMYQFVGLLDADGLTLEINRAALEGAALRLADVRGKPFWEARWWAVSPETVASTRALVQRAARGEFVRCDVEVYGQAAGEETIVIDFSVLPVKDADGSVVFLLAEGRNITEKKRAEAEIARKNEELQQLLDKLKSADQLKSDFFANISHELRTPLALILGPAEVMLSSAGNLSAAQRRDLQVMHRNATTLLGHVNDLLDLAKVDAGEMAASYARVDLAQALRRAAEQFDVLAPQRRLQYQVAMPERLEAEVDTAKVERVLLNLLSNAFKFTPAGGRVRCSLEAGANGTFVMSVQDSGPGVPADLRRAVFERFRQAGGGTRRDVGGTGLGLAIAKEFVDLHHGTIVVSDAPGGGALFQVEIPMQAPAGSFVRDAETPTLADVPQASWLGNAADLHSAEAEPTPAAAPDDRPCVLVVEDNTDMRRFIANLDVKSAFGTVLEFGADFPLADGWSIGLDARKIFVKTKADGVLPALGGATAHADVRLNPLVVFASVGRRF